MSENRLTKGVSSLPMLSSKCLPDNLNLNLHVTTTVAVHLLRDTVSLGKYEMDRYKFINEQMKKKY